MPSSVGFRRIPPESDGFFLMVQVSSFSKTSAPSDNLRSLHHVDDSLRAFELPLLASMSGLDSTRLYDEAATD